MKEFVIVTYPEERMVSVDKIPMRKTNLVMRVETGTHLFDLGRPLNYSPLAQIIEVTGTTKETPMMIAFVQTVQPRAGRKKIARKRSSKQTVRKARKTAKKAAKRSAKKVAKRSVRKSASRTVAKRPAKKATRKVAKNAPTRRSTRPRKKTAKKNRRAK